jgi:chromosome segregation ATPase
MSDPQQQLILDLQASIRCKRLHMSRIQARVEPMKNEFYTALGKKDLCSGAIEDKKAELNTLLEGHLFCGARRQELRTLRNELKGRECKCKTMYATIDKMDTDRCRLSMEVSELEAELEEREEEQVEIARMQDSPSAKRSRTE